MPGNKFNADNEAETLSPGLSLGARRVICVNPTSLSVFTILRHSRQVLLPAWRLTLPPRSAIPPLARKMPGNDREVAPGAPRPASPVLHGVQGVVGSNPITPTIFHIYNEGSKNKGDIYPLLKRAET